MLTKNREKVFKLKKFKKCVTALCLTMTLITTFRIDVSAKELVKWPSGPEVLSEAAYLMDMDTGTVLYSKNEDVQEHPASITKILTALIAAEKGNLKDTVTFSKEAIAGNESKKSSHIARDVGEKMSLEDCMYAMMLASANECADAIAEHIGGSKEKFVEMMNQKAKKLGCTNSHFVCSNGFIDEGHYVTAKDMAKIAAAAYKNPIVKKLVTTKKYTIPPTNVHEDPTHLINHHDMLIPYRTGKYVYKYCTGGKTGYTDIAKNTLVTYAEKDGKRLVCVILKDEIPYQKYKDTTALLDFGFDNYSHVEASQLFDIKTDASAKKVLKNTNIKETKLDTSFVTLPNNADIKDVSYSFKSITRKKGSAVVGKVSYKYGKIKLGESKVLNDAELVRELAKKNTSKKSSKEKAVKINITILIIVSVVVVIVLAVAACYFIMQKVNRDKWRERKLF